MKVSVVIAAYNAATTIGCQLGALIRQEWTGEWEIIVADNGSSDATRQVVEHYATSESKIRLVDASKKSGAAHARNVGVHHSTGECLLFCDADDEVSDGWLAAMAGSTQRYGLVASRLEADKLSSTEATKMRRCPQQNGLQEYRYPPYLPHAATAGLGVMREIHERVGGFDESFVRLADTDYCWRIQLSGVKLHFEHDALVHMRFRDTTKESCRQARNWGEYNVRLYKQYRHQGMPEISPNVGLRAWYRLLRKAPQALRGKEKEQWLWSFHWSLGRALGCFKYRVVAL